MITSPTAKRIVLMAVAGVLALNAAACLPFLGKGKGKAPPPAPAPVISKY